MPIQCYLGLGSNLRTPKRQLHAAVRALRAVPRTVVKQVSAFNPSKPLGNMAQPMYCNAIIHIVSKLPAQRLLHYCQWIEKRQGRVRKKRWASRTLDIDILTYGTYTIQKHNLTIPHPGILLRPFVYVPLFKMSPETVLFLQQKSMSKSAPPKQIAESATLKTGQ